MPRLQPDDLILAAKIVEASGNTEAKKLVQSDLDLQLKRHSLTTGDALEVLSGVMHFSKRELNRITVAKTVLELNGVLSGEDKVQSGPPQVNFIFQNSDVNLQGIFNPKRT